MLSLWTFVSLVCRILASTLQSPQVNDDEWQLIEAAVYEQSCALSIGFFVIRSVPWHSLFLCLNKHRRTIYVRLWVDRKPSSGGCEVKRNCSAHLCPRGGALISTMVFGPGLARHSQQARSPYSAPAQSCHLIILIIIHQKKKKH